MQSIYEKYRPAAWSDVVGQSAAVAKLQAIAKRNGFGGRAYWLAGSSGTGKTTIARLIAADVADDFAIDEIDAADLTADYIRDAQRRQSGAPIGGRGWAFIVNEAHGLTAPQVRKLLCVLESIAPYAVWIFTTTSAGEEKLFADMDDAGPLLSRCLQIKLSQRDLCGAFALRAQTIATAEGLNGQPIAKYERLAKDCRNNLRMMLQRIEAGEMLEGGAQ